MADDGVRIGKETVNRNQSRDAREQGKKRVERRTCSVGENPVLRDSIVDAQSNIRPTARRDLRWSFGKLAAPDYLIEINAIAVI